MLDIKYFKSIKEKKNFKSRWAQKRVSDSTDDSKTDQSDFKVISRWPSSKVFTTKNVDLNNSILPAKGRNPYLPYTCFYLWHLSNNLSLRCYNFLQLPENYRIFGQARKQLWNSKKSSKGISFLPEDAKEGLKVTCDMQAAK